MEFKKGQTVYFVRSKTEVIVATIINITDDVCTIKFKDKDAAGIRCRKSKLYLTEEDANNAIQYRPAPKRSSYKEYW